MSRVEYPGGIEARYRFLDKIDRRCPDQNGKCHRKAVIEFDAYKLDGDGNRTGEMITRKVCPKHKNIHLTSATWDIVEKRDLTGTHDDDGNRTVEGPWDRIARAQARQAAEQSTVSTTPRPQQQPAPATDLRFSG